MKKLFLMALLLVLLAVGAFYANSLNKKDLLYIREEESEEISKDEIRAQQKQLLFVGDIMLGRYVEILSTRENNAMYPFSKLGGFLKQYTTIANLEGPIPSVHKPTPVNGFSFSFPSSTPEVLKKGGITAVSLANNHMFDKGRNGYEETKRALASASVNHFGGYAPTSNDYFETTFGSQKVIVYGITMIAEGWDELQAIEVTRKLRQDHPHAYLIAYLHWGDEYVTQNIYQRAFAHSLIDAGVDAVIGSHPHVVQGIETYKGKPIFYSLGNFIFDQYWRGDLEDGVMIKLSDDEDSYRYEVIPIRSSHSIPDIATSSVRQKILDTIFRQSSPEVQQSFLDGLLKFPK